MDHLRIDDGIKRGPKPPPRIQARDPETGKILPICSHAERRIIIDDAIIALETGETTDEIASRHNITGRALRYWLIADDRTDAARASMFSARLLEAVQAIETATEPLPLARAREQFRAWSWLAERRAPRTFGQQQPQIAINAQGPMTVQIVSFSTHCSAASDVLPPVSDAIDVTD